MIHQKFQDEYLDEMANRLLDEWKDLDINYPKKEEGFYTSDDSLSLAMESGVDVDQNFGKGQPFDIEESYLIKDQIYITKMLMGRFPKCSISRSGFFYYPPGEGMRWHTNADTPYLRCYLNYSQNGDSYFKYYDQETKKTVVDMDFPGWNIRHFHINNEKDNLFWHSVYSRTHRISVGFRIINNLK
jgi:hypothetical protein